MVFGVEEVRPCSIWSSWRCEVSYVDCSSSWSSREHKMRWRGAFLFSTKDNSRGGNVAVYACLRRGLRNSWKSVLSHSFRLSETLPQYHFPYVSDSMASDQVLTTHES